jgi:hypothetical protein
MRSKASRSIGFTSTAVALQPKGRGEQTITNQKRRDECSKTRVNQGAEQNRAETYSSAQERRRGRASRQTGSLLTHGFVEREVK